jgi:hypothetical protein
MAIILDSNLPGGVAMNTAFHLAVQLGAREPGIAGRDALDATGLPHSGLPIWPNIVLAASPDHLRAILAAALAAAGTSRGMIGASRHAFTVGFLATMIFAVGPRILPSFLNSRELWSTRLMFAALVLLTTGCALRVFSEPLAYAGAAPWAWTVLPVSAVTELVAVLLFAVNLGATMASPMPAWILPRAVHENLPLYWYVTGYPATRRLLASAGLKTLARVRDVPRALTLKEAAEADGVDWRPLVAILRDFVERRKARALRGRS